jgi:putative transposase
MGNWLLRKKSHVVGRFLLESHLSARLTLSKLGVHRATFYYRYGGEPGLQDQSPMPKHVWNRVPDKLRRQVVKLVLKETELSSRELTVTFTDTVS